MGYGNYTFRDATALPEIGYVFYTQSRMTVKIKSVHDLNKYIIIYTFYDTFMSAQTYLPSTFKYSGSEWWRN